MECPVKQPETHPIVESRWEAEVAVAFLPGQLVLEDAVRAVLEGDTCVLTNLEEQTAHLMHQFLCVLRLNCSNGF